MGSYNWLLYQIWNTQPFTENKGVRGGLLGSSPALLLFKHSTLELSTWMSLHYDTILTCQWQGSTMDYVLISPLAIDVYLWTSTWQCLLLECCVRWQNMFLLQLFTVQDNVPFQWISHCSYSGVWKTKTRRVVIIRCHRRPCHMAGLAVQHIRV